MRKVKDIALVVAIIYIIISIIYMNSDDEIVDIKDTIEKVETVVDNSTPVSVTPMTIKVPKSSVVKKKPVIKNDSVIDEIVYKPADSVFIEAKEYKYVDSVSNGKLESWIVADNIYSRRIKLTTFNKKREITVVRSLWFIEFGPTFDFSFEVKSIDVGIKYVHKDKWSAGVLAGYDNMYKEPYVGFRIGIPLKRK